MKILGLLILLYALAIEKSQAAKITIKYEKPTSPGYAAIYKTLKAHHKQMLGESVLYLNQLYHWSRDIEIVVASCGFSNSGYQPEANRIVICYESLFHKINDYPEAASSEKHFKKRVLQNVMFTFWHEMGHAMIGDLAIDQKSDTLYVEKLADEFAALSMLWRTGAGWNDILMISALHYKNKSVLKPDRSYENHPNDKLRYQKIIVLLYGFSQKSYSRLAADVSDIEWLKKSAKEYYLERSAFWIEHLRTRTKREFFRN